MYSRVCVRVTLELGTTVRPHITLSNNVVILLPVDPQDEVLIAGFGRRGHAVGDIPGVRFKVRGKVLGGRPEAAALHYLG